MSNNPFGNVKLTGVPLGQPSVGSSNLGLPTPGQSGFPGANSSVFSGLNDYRTGTSNTDVKVGFKEFWSPNIINIAASWTPPGYSLALTTFSASQASQYIGKPGYDVRQFCSCPNHDPSKIGGHVYTYVVYYNPLTVPDPPVSETVPEDRCRFCDSCQDCNPPTTFPSLNLSISRFEATTAIYTYFDIAMEVRGNTYCAANITKDSDYKWTPEDGNGQDWNRAYFWILDNKFAGWADGVTPSPISSPSTLKIDPVFPPQRVKINNDGWLVEKINLNTPLPPTFPNTSVYDKLPGGGGLTTAQCREGCKHIYYEPVPLPDELPDNQKFTTIEDYFDAYHIW